MDNNEYDSLLSKIVELEQNYSPRISQLEKSMDMTWEALEKVKNTLVILTNIVRDLVEAEKGRLFCGDIKFC